MISATFEGGKAEVEAVYARVQKSGLKHGKWIDEFDEPGRGDHWGIAARDNAKLIASSEAFPYRPLAA